MPDDTQQQNDPVADMLGEGSGGGPAGAVSRFARRYLALKQGGAVELARMRMQEHAHQQDQTTQLVLGAADRGFDFGSPAGKGLLKGLPPDVAAFIPEYSHQQKTQKEQRKAQMMKMFGLSPEDLGQSAQGAGASTGGSPTAPTGASIPTPGPAPSGDSTAQMMGAGGVGQAAPTTAPRMIGPGQVDFSHPDTHAHIMATETPEERAQHKKASIAQFMYVSALEDHDPSAPGLKPAADGEIRLYNDMVNKRLGHTNTEEDIAQRQANSEHNIGLHEGAANARHADTETQENARHADTETQANRRASGKTSQDIKAFNTKHDAFLAEKTRYKTKKYDSLEQAQQAAEGLEAQRVQLQNEAADKGLKFDEPPVTAKDHVSGGVAGYFATHTPVLENDDSGLVGKSTKAPDGDRALNGRTVHVKGGKIVGVD